MTFLKPNFDKQNFPKRTQYTDERSTCTNSQLRMFCCPKKWSGQGKINKARALSASFLGVLFTQLLLCLTNLTINAFPNALFPVGASKNTVKQIQHFHNSCLSPRTKLTFSLMEIDVCVGHTDTRDFLNGIVLNQSLRRVCKNRRIRMWIDVSTRQSKWYLKTPLSNGMSKRLVKLQTRNMMAVICRLLIAFCYTVV